MFRCVAIRSVHRRPICANPARLPSLLEAIRLTLVVPEAISYRHILGAECAVPKRLTPFETSASVCSMIELLFRRFAARCASERTSSATT